MPGGCAPISTAQPFLQAAVLYVASHFQPSALSIISKFASDTKLGGRTCGGIWVGWINGQRQVVPALSRRDRLLDL